jgi:hypothetical protein
MNLFVIYFDTTDYPRVYVVRRWVYEEPHELIGMGGTLEEARGLIPAGLHNLGREAEDDGKIVEVWI